MPTYPDDAWVKIVCLIGQDERTCRYLTMSAGGWSCEKLSEIAAYLDGRVESGTMGARGNNCSGRDAR